MIVFAHQADQPQNSHGNFHMPRLISLYIRHIVIGFLLSAVFVTLLLATNVGNLWHLISTSPVGWIAALMLFLFNGMVFSGVQFAITIMSMTDSDTPGDGKFMPEPVSDRARDMQPVRIPAQTHNRT
jgi:hypothetical protein